MESIKSKKNEHMQNCAEDELFNWIKEVYDESINSEVEELANFINAMAERETNQNKDEIDAPTFFRTSQSTVNSTCSNDSNASVSVLFQDLLEEEETEQISQEKTVVPYVDKASDIKKNNNKLQKKKYRRRHAVRKRIKKNRNLTKAPKDSSKTQANEMVNLFRSIHEQCRLSGSATSSKGPPKLYELPEMAIKSIKILEEEEEKDRGIKQQLKEEQVILLKRLINLLEDVPKPRSNNFHNYLIKKRNKKFSFLGFRSSKISKSTSERLTAAKLFGSSPPRSSTRHRDRVHTEPAQDLTKMKFVFEPTPTTLADLNHRLTIRKPPSQKRDKRNTREKSTDYLQLRPLVENLSVKRYKRRREDFVAGVQNKDSVKLTMEKKREKLDKKRKTRKTYKRVWATNLTGKKQKKITRILNGQFTKRKLIPDPKHSSSPKTKDQPTLNLDVKQKLAAPGSTSSISSTVTPKSMLSTRNIRLSTKLASSSCQLKAIKQESARIQRSKRKIGKNRTDKGAKRKASSVAAESNSKNDYQTVRVENLSSNSSNVQFHYSGNDSKNKVIGSPIRNDLLRNSSYRSTDNEPPVFFYPVHPYTSPDLPVHFIPVNPRKLPEVFPLYLPIQQKENTTNVFPSFVQIKGSGSEASYHNYIRTNGIYPTSLPHQTLPAQAVYSRILPGLIPSPCPLVPSMAKHKTSSGDSFFPKALENVQIESYKSVSESSSTVLNGRGRQTQSNSSSLVQNQVLAPIGQGERPTNIQRKIHKCNDCSFETFQLGVLKRHQLVHSKIKSTIDLTYPGSFAHIENSDSRIENAASPTHSLFSSPPKESSNSDSSSEGNESGIKIVSTESLKESFSVQDPFHGFPNVKNSIFQKFPGVTITPLIDLKD